MDGRDEPWKEGSDEEPEERPTIFGIPIIQPRTATAEERAKAEDAYKKQLSLGELSFASLPLFLEGRTCRKCGHGKATVGYHRRGEFNNCLAHAGLREHFHRKCERCDFMWLERVLEEDPQ